MGTKIGGADFMRSKNRDVRSVHGRFQGNGTGAPTRLDGAGWTVSRSGVGVYVITCDQAYPKLLGGGGAELANSPNTYACRLSAYSIGTGGNPTTFTITVFQTTTGTATDLTSTEEIWFEFNVGWSQRS